MTINVYPQITNPGFSNNNSQPARLDLGTGTLPFVARWSYKLRIGYYGHPSPPGQNAYRYSTMVFSGSHDNSFWTQLDIMSFTPHPDVKNYYIDPGSPFEIPYRTLAQVAHYRYYKWDWGPLGYQQGGNCYDGMMAMTFETKAMRDSSPIPHSVT